MNYHNFHIISPCFNNQEYLDKCINSIENQDYPKDYIEMTLIDDSSKYQLKTEETSFKIKKIRNLKRMYMAYNRFIAFSESNDNDIIIFLDGDDWLCDNKCLKTINKIYNENNIHWSVSNHKIFVKNKLKVLPQFVNTKFDIEKPKICHLRCGYGYVWNDMDISWIKKDNKYIKWMTDWNENLFAYKKYGEPFKINCSLSVYNNQTPKTRNENNDFKEMINFFKNKFI